MKRVLTVILTLAMLLSMMGATMVPVSASQTVQVMGDLNGDREMNTLDARAYLQLIAEDRALSTTQKAIADFNGDGAYSTLDVRELLMRLVYTFQPVRSVWIPYMEMESLLSSKNPATCRAAIDACFDDCVARGANTVYFHVRANSDAYYDSSVYDPNSKTASLLAQGFDPLAYAVESAHAKGLKLEAWVNPYRIGTDTTRIKADATFTYDGRYYYVPSDADVKALVLAGVRELVENYDIDGIQFDDYFYPTGSVSATTPASFEQADYTAYTQAGGTLAIGDWRRAQVNELIKAVYGVCHSRTGCVFGISPAYDFENDRDTMYADVETWAVTPGYVDYLCPQLYVGFEHQYAPFESIVSRWNTLPRHHSVALVAGLALYKTGLLNDTYAGTGNTEWAENDDILAREIAVVKELNWNGAALYSHLSFESDSTRDATIVAAESASACEAWLIFN